MRHWGLKSWRQAAVPLAVVSLVSAVGIGWGTSHAELVGRRCRRSDGDLAVRDLRADAIR